MGSARIQVVEDESIIRLDVKNRLRALGYSVAGEAATGEDAIRVAEETRPDLVLMDIRLKGAMDGIEAAKVIWVRMRIPVIYLTANADDDTLQRAKLAEPFGYLLKPFEARELHTAIEIALYKYRMETTLHAEKERLRVTLGSIADGVITTDTTGCVDYLNPAAECLCGWSGKQAIGEAIEDVFNVVDQSNREPLVNPVRRCLQDERAILLEQACVLVRYDGQQSIVQHSAAPIRDAKGCVVGVVLVCHDISDLQEMTQRMAHLATHDSLTNLLNRAAFEDLLQSALQRARGEGHRSALCYLDLDHFKIVNDSCGHAAGDELLKQIAGLLQSALRRDDVLARLGGDEFGIILSNCNMDEAYLTAQRIGRAIESHTFAWEGSLFQVSASAGLVSIAPETADIGELLRMVDSACYVAKDAGRNRVHHYRTNDAEVSRHRGQMYWVQRIQDALRTGTLSLYCQPTRALLNGGRRVQYHELLLRIMEGDGRAITAAKFIPTAERFRLMVALDRWVVDAAFERIAQYDNPEPIIYGINLSGQSLSEEGFLDFVLEKLKQHRVQPERICFEITESAAVTSFPRALGFVSALRRAGCSFALDDFGSGMSSFQYLKNLEIDYLKIDGSFVRSMVTDTYSCSLVQAINDIGHTLGVLTIAEFVESEDIIAKLRDLGVDYAQGYAIAHPAPSEVPIRKTEPA